MRVFSSRDYQQDEEDDADVDDEVHWAEQRVELLHGVEVEVAQDDPGKKPRPSAAELLPSIRRIKSHFSND